ncbi:MAG TPA: tetratricopeptide repeat protein [Alphaproteobacteria bacterium]|nr:tetratricopeptide repeat protein [Alphaproteobacteria bacterium]
MAVALKIAMSKYAFITIFLSAALMLAGVGNAGAGPADFCRGAAPGGTPPGSLDAASALFARLHYRAQAAACDAALATTPGDTELRFQRGRALLLAGRPLGLVDLEAAAQANHLPALRWLGAAHRSGLAPVDWSRARQWLRQAAGLGDAVSQFALAELLAAGEGGAADPAASLEWVQKAAAQGHASALFELSMRHQGGHGVTADAALAFDLLKQALAAELPKAIQALAMIYLRPDQDAVRRAEGLALLQGLADKGNATAVLILAQLYLRGGAVKRDAERGVALLEPLAEAGDLQARIELGHLFFKGYYVRRDLARGSHWYCLAGGPGARHFSAYHRGEELVCK